MAGPYTAHQQVTRALLNLSHESKPTFTLSRDGRVLRSSCKRRRTRSSAPPAPFPLLPPQFAVLGVTGDNAAAKGASRAWMQTRAAAAAYNHVAPGKPAESATFSEACRVSRFRPHGTARHGTARRTVARPGRHPAACALHRAPPAAQRYSHASVHHAALLRSTRPFCTSSLDALALPISLSATHPSPHNSPHSHTLSTSNGVSLSASVLLIPLLPGGDHQQRRRVGQGTSPRQRGGEAENAAQRGRRVYQENRAPATPVQIDEVV